MSRWVGVAALLGLVALGVAACGGDAKQTPSGPTSSAVSSGTQGATIMGNVSAGTPMGAMAAQVTGTSISSPISAGGDFSLKGVPDGGVQLRFVGSGVDASVGLSPVRSGDVVSLLVGVSGSTATIQSESRNAGGKVELEGRIESLTLPDTLVVDGRTVKTTDQTVIRDDNGAAKAFADLKIGQRVHVSGTLAEGKVTASIITIQNTNTSIPVVVNGIVASLTGTASDFSFTIDGRLIKGDGTTAFYGDNDVPLTFSSLKNGSRVEVKGEQKDGYVYAVRIHINGPTEPQDDSASVEGIVSGLSGTPPTLTMMIGSTKVTTTSATVVQRRGDKQTLAEVKDGQTVHAVGVRQPDGSIVARLLQIKDDATDGPFVIEGSLGGLKGTCPTITFGVNGYSIATTNTTVFTPSCTDLKSGAKVEVKGTRQSDGSVLATAVTKK